MLADLAELAPMTGIARDSSSENRVIAQMVTNALGHMQNWILVFDGAASEQQIGQYVPASGKVLVTSQNPSWSRRCTCIGLDRMRRSESVDLLTALITELAAKGELELLADLCADHALMLKQAASYIAVTGMSLANYLELLRTRRPEMLERGPLSGRESLAATIDSNLADLDPESRGPTNALAMLSSEPLTILQPPAHQLEGAPGWLRDPLIREDALAELRRKSLVSRSSDVLQMHELIADRTFASLTDAERAIASLNALGILNTIIPGEIDWHKENRAFNLTLPHLLRLNQKLSDAPAEAIVKAVVRMRLGSFYSRQGEDSQAREFLEDSRSTLEQLNLASEGPLLASALHNLGELSLRQRKITEAETLTRRALGLTGLSI